MSGGYISEEGLKDGEHQVVIFAFKGPIAATKGQEWNEAINSLKKMFGNQVIAVTMQGLPTPPQYMPPASGLGAKPAAKTPGKKTQKKRPGK